MNLLSYFAISYCCRSVKWLLLLSHGCVVLISDPQRCFFYWPWGNFIAADVIPCVCFWPADVPHSYHHYYSNPSYHTLSQNRPPLPHLPNNHDRTIKVSVTLRSWVLDNRLLKKVVAANSSLNLTSVRLTEHQQPAVLQREKHGAGEAGSVWGREQRHPACRLETPRATQRLRLVRATLRLMSEG